MEHHGAMKSAEHNVGCAHIMHKIAASARLAPRTAGALITDSMQWCPHLWRLGEPASGEGLGVRLQMHFSMRSAILSRFSLRLHRCHKYAGQQEDRGHTF